MYSGINVFNINLALRVKRIRSLVDGRTFWFNNFKKIGERKTEQKIDDRIII